MPSKFFDTVIRSRSLFETRAEPARAVSTPAPSMTGVSAARASASEHGASYTGSNRVSHERLEELLKNWARWCRGSAVPSMPVVVDIGYLPPGEGAQEARREPKPPKTLDYEGLLVELAVNRLTPLQKNVVRVEYVLTIRRKDESADQLQERRRRRLRIPRLQYEESLRVAKAVLAQLICKG